MKLFSKKLSWIYMAAVLTACGGGGDGGDNGAPDPGTGDTPTPPPTEAPTPTPNVNGLNQKQQAFFNTVYPILRNNCSGCHGENPNASAGNIDLPKFADQDVASALQVIEDRGFFDLSDPSSSRFVSRIADDTHGCWPNAFECSQNASTVQAAISQYAGLVPTQPTPVPTPDPGLVVQIPDANDTEIAVEAFKNSVLSELVAAGCNGCHRPGGGAPPFADPDNVEASLDEAVERKIADVSDVAGSKLVLRLRSQHGCAPAQCESAAVSMEGAISAWNQLTEDYNENGFGDPGNNAPSATDDSFDVLEGQELVTGNVVANDVEVDNGDLLSVTDYDEVSAEGFAVVYNGNATFTYTPDEGFVGEDSFEYTITDSGGESSSATVVINVIENQGIVAVDDLVLGGQDQVLNIDRLDLTGNDDVPAGTVASIVIAENRSDAGGTVVLNADGNITYTPPRGFTGEDKFDYSITDGTNFASAEVTISINAAPIAVDDGDYTFTGFDLVTLNVLKNDLDINGDTLRVSSIDTTGTQGTVTNNGDGTFDYRPENGVQQDSFEYTVTDDRGGAATAQVTINIVDQILEDDDDPIINADIFADLDDDRFLRSLNRSNPAALEDSSTALAYYAAVDPGNERLNRRAFYQKNGMLNGDTLQVDQEVVYQNANDLGFIRLFRIKRDREDNILASCVQNYINFVDGLAAQAAAFDDEAVNLLATVCMETKPADGENPDDPNAEFSTVFYGYGPDDERFLDVSLDGRFSKEVPGVCNACHGGKPKSLVNGSYPDDGDTRVRNIPWYVDTFAFEDDPNNIDIGVNAVDKEETEVLLKDFNEILIDYGIDVQPGAIAVIEGSYGGPGLPADEFNEDFVPEGWRQQQGLYRQVVSPFCRACHLQLGSDAQDDIAFNTFDAFMSFRDRIEELVFDDSTMPLARLTFERFWDDPRAAEVLARAIGSNKLLEGDTVLSPGRVLANAGPSREAAIRSEVILEGGASFVFNSQGLDQSVFTWELATPSGSQAELENPNAVRTTFFADVPGIYKATLVIDDGDVNTPDSPPAEVVINVREDIAPVSFNNDVAPIMERCAGCHSFDGANGAFAGTDLPDFGARGILFDSVIEYVDVENIEESLILLKPSGQSHNGGVIPGFESKAGEGYTTILRWISEGAANF